MELCPCSSGLTYSQCCQPLHNKIAAKNALELMRARYSAYVLNKANFIIDTTHPASPHYYENKFSWKRNISTFASQTKFLRLEIHEFQENDSLAMVHFTVYIEQNEQNAVLSEKSFFSKIENNWYYLIGLHGKDSETIAEGPLKLLPVAYYGHPILRQKARAIETIDEQLKVLVDKMIATMDAHNGIGLAAPQIFHSLRLFIARDFVEKEEGKFECGDVEVYINPVLSLPSKSRWKTNEGCLSIPRLRADVERPEQVTVEYTNLLGERITKELQGWAARVVMHENDHINGILYIDRVEKKEQQNFKSHLKNLELILPKPKF